jgi:ABC-type nitrate/sulfonate/bicarbonate transport system permease component
VLQAQQTFAIPEMWGGIILLAIVGYVVNLGFVLVQDKVLMWREGSND